jgi:hypothetical protein
MVMPKKPVSLTLEETNLLWLKGRARVLAGGSLSEAVDQLIDEARAGKLGAAEPPRSVVGTIDLPDDSVLLKAGEELRGLFDASLGRPIFAPQAGPAAAASKARRRKK